MSERSRSLRFGWSLLLLAAVAGIGLELAHGFKLGPYLDDSLTRLLLTLAHAHGVGLALVVLAYAVAGTPLVEARWPGRALRAAALAIPLGFGLGAVAHPEGDPSGAIILVPLGAGLLLAALGHVAWQSWRAAAKDPGRHVEIDGPKTETEMR